MMKIGILTFCEANNYGAMCQAFALQHFLNINGYETILLRYRNRSLYIQYNFRKLSESKKISVFLKRNLNVLINYKRNHKFNIFRKSLPITKVLNRTQLISYSNQLDAIIVGSDQVWNPKNTGNDKTFLLDFASNHLKKIAYAASFANTSLFKGFGENAIECIRAIPFISLREQEGVDFLKQFDIEGKLVLDPVLLMRSFEWKKRINQSLCCDSQYIFVYQLRPDLYFIDYLNKLSDITGLKIYILPYLYPCKRDAQRLKNKRILYNLSPDEFLSFIAGANLVATDSFHGAALSIALNKDFYVSLDKNTVNTNSRIVSLLGICGLSNRIIDVNTTPALISKIDYHNVEKKLDNYRNISSTFLFDALKTNY